MDDKDRAAAWRLAVASNIRAERARMQMTQEQVAVAMRPYGYRWHAQTASEVEQGGRSVRADELLALAEVLNTDPGLLWRVA